MLNKTYDPKSFEEDIYNKQQEFFNCEPSSSKTPFTVMMPPPNVTGSLHLGHALNDTLQDIMVRFHRKKGKDVLWQPGTDHAGIATQIVVERQLSEKGITRHDLGRDAFIEKVWAWKEESGNTILNQKKRLGISPDWKRARFTMDEGLCKAVLKVFVSLYKQGLIYRAKRLVNWDTKLHTAISDLEVVQNDQKGHLWYIRYPIQDSHDFITVATTRPETMFGDTAVAVHPEDERYQHLIGKNVVLPFVNRIIPIIADSYCDPSKGSGAVKITPGHDFNDFMVGQRHHLEMINILDEKGILIDPTPKEFQGLSVSKARELVVKQLEEMNLLEKIEPIQHTVPYSERSNVEIQPWLTDQWFVDAPQLAGPAIEAVKEGKTKFFPENWANTYFEWLNNIQPWCISRQIWWGHQIPAWYGPDGHVFVEETEEEAFEAAKHHYGKETKLTRDSDVLDTWFSSALWPFTTLGWPEKTKELERYYSTDLLMTGFDIIFFWVARMMMMGLHFMKDVPFKTVYIHALVRDEKGQKMSKSRGNIIDPLVLIDKYGADALRFSLALLAAPGRDVKIGESRVEQARNFITKIWNAARFLQMNECVYSSDFDPLVVKGELNQWIIHKTSEMIQKVSEEIEGYRFDLASQTLYHFLWGTYCDIYVECLKPLLNDEHLALETRHTATFVLMQFLKVANPFMPFVTEHLWQAFGGSGLLIQKEWPDLNIKFENAVQYVDWAVNFIQEVRSIKGLLGLNPSLKLTLLSFAQQDDFKILKNHESWINHLARFEKIDSHRQGEGIPFVFRKSNFIFELPDGVNVGDIKNLLNQKRETLQKEILHLSKKLENEAFKTAKFELWEKDQELFQNKTQEVHKIQSILEQW